MITVSRRQVLKAGIASMFFPLIRLDISHEPDMSALVNEFCDTPNGSRRFTLDSPWEFEGDSVACDGRALIRVPGLRYAHRGEEGRRPNARELFSRCWRDARWRRIPSVQRIVSENGAYCSACSRTPCRHCDGEGDLWIDEYSSAGQCSKCLGLGYIPRKDCPICYGLRENFPSLEVWGDTVIDARFGMLIRQIPGAWWLPPDKPTQDGQYFPLLVRGDGGVMAMVMPIA